MVVKGKIKVAKYYENKYLAGDYIEDRYTKPLGKLNHVLQINILNSLIRGFSCKNVLEIAIGPARIAKDLKGYKKGLGIDNSQQMLDIAVLNLKNKNWKLYKINAFNFSTKNNFDLVYSFKFIRHLNYNERKKIYGVIKKILTKDTLFVLDVPNKNVYSRYSKKYPSLVYDEYWDLDEINKEFIENNFVVYKVYPILKHFKIQELISKLSKFKFLNSLLYFTLKLIENLPGKNPFEWVFVLKKAT